MKLEKLLSKIEEDTKEEITDLQEQYKLKRKKIDEDGKERIEKLEKELEEKFKKEKEKALEDYRKEREFAHQMELLSLKKKLLEEAKEATKKDTRELSLEKKKEILEKKLSENMSISEDMKFTVFVPEYKKKDFVSIFSDIDSENIKERKMNEDGFIVEGERFVYEVSLPLIVDEIVEKESELFARLLFKE